jgi:transposase
MKTLSNDALIIASRQELIDIISSLSLQVQQQKTMIEEMSFKLDWFKRQIFGAKSERFIPADDLQAALELDIVASENPAVEKTSLNVSYNRKNNATGKKVVGHGRGTMPSHLPIKDVVVEPVTDLDGFVRLGEEVSWHYEMKEPGSLHIVRTTRPKYVKPKHDGVVIGELAPLPVEKGNAGPGLVTQIIIDKYVYHMPLDRQCKKFKNEYNVDFSTSWFSDNVKHGTFWLEAVYNGYVRKILQATYLQADETPIQVLTKDQKGKTHRGYFWVYYDPVQKIVLFDYRTSRAKQGPSEFLKDFKGTLQVDGYEGYAEIIARNALLHAACMDHLRRRFEKALAYDCARATYALDTIGSWYALERQARESNLPADELLAMRKQIIEPSMNAFKQWMLAQVNSVLPKSVLGNALSYALNQWAFFAPFINDPRVQLSNILVENAIRPVALGRKNFLFAGSHDAARWPAVIYSLVSTAKLHGHDPFVYIKELLTVLPQSTTTAIDTLLLPNWAPALKE